MSVFAGHFSGQRAAGLLLVLLLVGGRGAVCGQVTDDTSRTQDQGMVAPPAPLDSVRAADVSAPDTSAPERAIVTADSLSAMVRQGERVQELFDNVHVRQDTTRLRSNYGLRYLNRDELLFTGDVVIFERGDTLRADTVWYNKRTKVGRARSNVRLTDGEVVVRAPKAIYFTEEKRSVFPDSVTLVDSNRVLHARQGTYWSNARRAEFSGNVHLTDPETHLEADSLAYFRDTERSIATGSVFIRRVDTTRRTKRETETVADTTVAPTDTATVPSGTPSVPIDTTAITYLFGEWADNQEQNRYSRVERQALLVRVRRDSTGAPDDTLAVRAHRLEAKRTDTYRRLVAVDSVRIWQADLAAVADSAVYDRVVAAGAPDTTATPAPMPTPHAAPDDDTTKTTSSLDSLVARAKPVDVSPPDSAETSLPSDTTARPDTRRGRPARSRSGRASRAAESTGRQTRSGWGTPSVSSDDELPLEETRLFRNPVAWFERAQVWGDSIRVRGRNRSLDTVYVRGSAFAAQQDTTVDRIRQLKGRNITAFFRRDSLRQILARPNGEAIYFSSSESGELNGATKASADFVRLHFRRGDVERIKFGRGVQGTAYHKKEYIPDPFRLVGFQWTPERRPTRMLFRREKRVRERLQLAPPEADSATKRPSPVARAPADSLAPRPDASASDSEARPSPRSESASSAEQGRHRDRSDAPADSLRRRAVPRESDSPPDTSDTSNPSP